MNNSDYQDLPAISSHWLIAMLDSPRQCFDKYLDPMRPPQSKSDALRFGTLVHGLALTPNQFDREFLVADYERRSLTGKAHHAELTATGLTVIKPVELEKAHAIVATLKSDPEVRKLLRGGKKERTIIQPRARGLLPLKARLDIHHESKRQVVELKTTYSLRAVETAMERYHYPLSAAFYRDMSQSLNVIFVFVQTAPPYEVAVIPMDKPQLQTGREQWQAALQRFDQCWKTNEWPDVKPTAPELDDDPLMMNFLPAMPSRRRFEIPVGELAL